MSFDTQFIFRPFLFLCNYNPRTYIIPLVYDNIRDASASAAPDAAPIMHAADAAALIASDAVVAAAAPLLWGKCY